MLHTITDVVSAILLLTGSLFTLSAAVGLLRFRSTLSRIHAITKPQTIGLMLCISGAIIRVIGHPDFSINNRSDLGVLLLLVLFTLLTSPVVGQRVGRSARRERLAGDDLAIDEQTQPQRRSRQN